MDRSVASKRAKALAGLDAAAAFSGGLELIRADHAEILLPAARRLATRFPGDARILQLLGLAARTAQDSSTAVAAFARAQELAPADPLIAHSFARASLEAGNPAVARFENAARLAPRDGSVILGLAAALLHERSAQASIDLLDQVTASNPLWIDAHRDAARIRAQVGLDPCATVEKAIGSSPASGELWMLLIHLALESRDLERAMVSLDHARSQLGASRQLSLLEAHIRSETNEVDEADQIFGAIGDLGTADASLIYVRHLLRANRPDAAIALIEPLLAQDRDHALVPYLSLASRMTGSEHWEWLEGHEELVRIFDLAEDIPDFTQLVDAVRKLHFAKSAPLDQSVRGGTQTDGNLLLRTEEPIAALKSAIMDKVADYTAGLPAPMHGHPTLLSQREPLRLAGSWSVRLEGAGFHTDHVHSQGWISSALYLALPDSISDDDERHGGWLSLGESRDLVPALEPLRLIQPKEGRLVLFPSTMWHGTRPFPSGERMTVAFDVARPQQG